MCNFYMMYWTEGPLLGNNYCFSWGPPVSYWHRLPMGFSKLFSFPWLSGIPEETRASKIDTKEILSYVLGKMRSE